MSPIWRTACQGVGLDDHVNVWQLLQLMLVAACGAVRASAGSRRLVMLIFGGWVPQDLCSSHVRCLKSSAAARGRVLRRRIAELLCASRGCSGRLASRNGVWGLARVGESPASGGGDLLPASGVGGWLCEGVARRQGCRRNRVGMGSPGSDLPAVGGQFAGDRDRDDPTWFVAGVLELAPAGVQAALRFQEMLMIWGECPRWRRSSASPTAGPRR